MERRKGTHIRLVEPETRKCGGTWRLGILKIFEPIVSAGVEKSRDYSPFKERNAFISYVTGALRFDLYVFISHTLEKVTKRSRGFYYSIKTITLIIFIPTAAQLHAVFRSRVNFPNYLPVESLNNLPLAGKSVKRQLSDTRSKISNSCTSTPRPLTSARRGVSYERALFHKSRGTRTERTSRK